MPSLYKAGKTRRGSSLVTAQTRLFLQVLCDAGTMRTRSRCEGDTSQRSLQLFVDPSIYGHNRKTRWQVSQPGQPPGSRAGAGPRALSGPRALLHFPGLKPGANRDRQDNLVEWGLVVFLCVVPVFKHFTSISH